jgi:hypothetical protein
MGAVLAPMGSLFFARHGGAAAMHVAWRGPWLLAVALSMAGLWCVPFYAFLEGCGEVRAVAAMRLRQSLAATALAWTAMMFHHGLYSPALVILGQIVVGLPFLLGHRRFLLEMLRHASTGRAVHWKTEVWPFQWRIAVSWMCCYFTVQILIPILFALHGAVDAGRMGMSLSITGYMTVLALSWTSTKATPFGSMIARGAFRELDRLFQRALLHSLAAFAVLAFLACAFAAVLPSAAPTLARRMVPVGLFAALVLGAGANCAVQSMATVLRSFKREPFLAQSLTVASLTLGLAFLTAPRWGNAGAAFSYLAANAGVALPWAAIVFVRARKDYRRAETTEAQFPARRFPLDCGLQEAGTPDAPASLVPSETAQAAAHVS